MSDKLKFVGHPKRHRRCALPAHSKFCLAASLAYNHGSLAQHAVLRPAISWPIHIKRGKSALSMSSQTQEQREKSAGAAGVLDAPSPKIQANALEEDRDTLLKMFRQMLLIR